MCEVKIFYVTCSHQKENVNSLIKLPFRDVELKVNRLDLLKATHRVQGNLNPKSNTVC